MWASIYISECLHAVERRVQPERTLRDDLPLQCLDFVVASYPIKFSPEASEGIGHTRDETVRTLTQCNKLLLRPASDNGLCVLGASMWFVGRGVGVWRPRTAV
jgi:hypothetical protein